MRLAKTLSNALFWSKEVVLTVKDVAVIFLMLAYLMIVIKVSL
tara:strand:+ start:183 stop:311 length:129 start_codon:yes stop_codon:yes gene_type:complete